MRACVAAISCLGGIGKYLHKVQHDFQRLSVRDEDLDQGEDQEDDDQRENERGELCKRALQAGALLAGLLALVTLAKSVAQRAARAALKVANAAQGWDGAISAIVKGNAVESPEACASQKGGND